MLLAVGSGMMGVGYLMGEYSVEIRWWVANQTEPSFAENDMFTLEELGVVP